MIEGIVGYGVINENHASLQFRRDGRLGSGGGCNRLIGSYSLNGEALFAKLPGTTMMAFPGALMRQSAGCCKWCWK